MLVAEEMSEKSKPRKYGRIMPKGKKMESTLVENGTNMDPKSIKNTKKIDAKTEVGKSIEKVRFRLFSPDHIFDPKSQKTCTKNH